MKRGPYGTHVPIMPYRIRIELIRAHMPYEFHLMLTKNDDTVSTDSTARLAFNWRFRNVEFTITINIVR